MDLQALIDLIQKKWPWTEERYPEMRLRHGEPGSVARQEFQRRHVLLHLSKEVGKLSELEERLDHGRHSGAHTARKEQIGKMLISVLQFAMVENITAEELTEAVKKIFHSAPA